MTKRLSAFTVTFLACLVMLHALWSNAFGYSLEGPKWSNNKATFYINTQYGPSGCLDSFQNALQTWSEVNSSSFEFIYGGTTTAHAFGERDGANRVDFGSLSSNYWGYTVYWYGSSNNFLDADLRLNSSKPWGTSSSYDVETVALHEFGHALGLWHSTDSAAVMHSRVEDQLRTLHQDDINGISKLYPAPNSTPLLYQACLNSDNKTDLIYVSRKGYVYYTTNLSSWTQIGTNKLTQVAVGDFDNDSQDEIAGINTNGYAKFANDNASALDNETEWIKVGTNKFTKLTAGDFNGDGIDELVGINYNGYAKYCSDNATVWVADKDDPSTTIWQTKIGMNKFKKLAVGDFDADGTEELIGINYNGYAKYCSDNSIQWIADQDDPSTTCWLSKIGMNKFKKLIVGDFAGNSAHELVGINYNGYAKYCSDSVADWVADQDDPSTTNWQTKIGMNKFKWLTSGNFDGVGKDELVGVNKNGYAKYCSDNATAWVADQDNPSTTNWQTKIGMKRFSSALVAGDFNGDGKDDVAGINRAYHVLYSIDNSTAWSDATEWTKIEKP